MKITKLGHSCLLVEMPAPVNRTALFDPGVMSEVNIDSLEFLDDIIVTHEHGDHMNIDLIKRLQQKFPQVRLTASPTAAALLRDEGLPAVPEVTEGMEIFEALHEAVAPLFPDADNIGVHYLDKLTHPGDCTHFAATKAILALPVTAPWGSSVEIVNQAIALKPQYIIPIHDWHWNDDARQAMYDLMADVFEKEGITFCRVENGRPIVLDV